MKFQLIKEDILHFNSRRMIDGLGFRYYWSTDGLRAKDLAYQPKGEGQNINKR